MSHEPVKRLTKRGIAIVKTQNKNWTQIQIKSIIGYLHTHMTLLLTWDECQVSQLWWSLLTLAVIVLLKTYPRTSPQIIPNQCIVGIIIMHPPKICGNKCMQSKQSWAQEIRVPIQDSYHFLHISTIRIVDTVQPNVYKQLTSLVQFCLVHNTASQFASVDKSWAETRSEIQQRSWWSTRCIAIKKSSALPASLSVAGRWSHPTAHTSSPPILLLNAQDPLENTQSLVLKGGQGN